MDVLALLESKGLSPIHAGGSEYKMTCINQEAHGDGYDSNPSMYVNIDKNVIYCQTCSFRMNEVALTKWLIGDELDEFMLAALSLKGALKRIKNAEEPFLQEAEEFTMMPPSVPWDRDYRGISKEFLKSVGARSCSVGRYENRIILPIYVNGRLRGFDSRGLSPEMKPKYLRSRGFDAVNEGLYPLDIVRDMRTTYVIICEGIFDALNAVFLGFPAICIFGTQFGMQKLSLLMSTGISEVVLLMDNDDAGNKAQERISAEIKDWLTVSIADKSLLVDRRDLGDLDAAEIDYCVQNRRRVK